MAGHTLGMIETRSLTGALAAVNVMLKKGKIKLAGKVTCPGGIITMFVEGEYNSVKSAVEAGADSAGMQGELIAYHLIHNPHPKLKLLFPNNF